VAIKHSVVLADERESGLRMILNFGHTAGHAIEADGYRYRHGEAVALGMLVATHIAVTMDLVGGERYAQLVEMLESAGLPTRLDGAIDAVLDNMKSDKKIVAGTRNWILPSRAGGVEIRRDVEIELVARSLAAVGGR
jgi:3-dehydroquinate synthetase